MKRRFWQGVLLLTLLVTLGIGWVSSGSGESAQTAFENLLQVDTGRLRSHLQALVHERYEAADLARTRTYLRQQLQEDGLTLTEQPFAEGINLIAERPGTVPTAGTILVGAHYDTVSLSPGADDNASGVVAALEIARIFAQYPTPSTLKVVFFDQEERQPSGEGLLGSTAFVISDNNLVDLKAAVILEMLGHACDQPGCQTYPAGLPLENPPDRGNFIGVLGDTEHPALLTAFATPESGPNPDQVPVITLPVHLSSALFAPDLLRSDHAPFWIKGIGAVMATDTANFRNPHYHQPTDTLDTLDLNFLTKATQTVVYAVEKLLTSNPI